MNPDHFAIVIGLTTYRGFTPPADLAGPENDADSVYAWLADPQGGGLPAENIKRIKSSGFAPPPADEPWPGHLEREAFEWIDELAVKNQEAMKGRSVGQRLYFHASGHGFSTERREGCLLTANARQNKTNANIGVTGWLRWWQDAGYFHEYVVVLDCCMNRMSSAVPSAPPLAGIVTQKPPGPSFVAYAAKRPLKAVEAEVPDGGGSKFHGVFTWAFLDGLKGAARTASGSVTGHSMANWLRNALHPRFADADRKNTGVSQEPEIVEENPNLILARVAAPFRFAVVLEFSADAVGKTARLWSGAPLSSSEFVALARTPVNLAPGLHLVEVQDTGYRQGFVVVQAGTVTVTEKGPKVAAPQPGAAFQLDIDAGDAANQIAIADANFEVADNRMGRITVSLPAGLYRTRIHAGEQFTDRVILLDGDSQPAATTRGSGLESIAPAADGFAVPRVASAVPFVNGPQSHEYHSPDYRGVAVGGAFVPHVTHGAGAELFIMARSWTPGSNWQGGAPWKGVTLVDANGITIADLSVHGVRHENGDPIAVCGLTVSPGCYFLRYAPEHGEFAEQALIATKGWRLETYLLRTIADGFAAAPQLSLLMRKPGAYQWMAEERDERLEKAKQALASERPVLGEELERILLKKYENPLEGIIGAHLLLIQRAHDNSANLELLDEVVTNLRRLVGTEHPDVEALSLRCPKKSLRRKTPFTAPPMFERSWRLMVEASQHTPALVPIGLWQRVHAAMAIPPYFVWSTDHAAKKDHHTALVEAARREFRPVVVIGLQPIATTASGGRPAPKRAAKPSAKKAAAKLGVGSRPTAALAKRPTKTAAGTFAVRRNRFAVTHNPLPSTPVDDPPSIFIGQGRVSSRFAKTPANAPASAPRSRFAENYGLPPSALLSLRRDLDGT